MHRNVLECRLEQRLVDFWRGLFPSERPATSGGAGCGIGSTRALGDAAARHGRNLLHVDRAHRESAAGHVDNWAAIKVAGEGLGVDGR